MNYEKLTFSFGSERKTEIKEIQKVLQVLGFYNFAIDGEFSAATETAVREYQKSKNLTVDGIVGENTYKSILEVDINAYKNKTKYTIEQIIDFMKSKNYIIRERPYEVNIVGIRRDRVFDNLFSDRCVIFWKTADNKWNGFEIKWTTLAGTLGSGGSRNPITVLGLKGVAVLYPKQYVQVYKFFDDYVTWLGYPFMQQIGNMSVYRDGDSDDFVDTDSPIQNGSGFGINIHRMSNNGIETNTVNSQWAVWSMGCQGSDEPSFKKFIESVRYSFNIYKQYFDYTLLEHKDL